jgi:hypothetical protein
MRGLRRISAENKYPALISSRTLNAIENPFGIIWQAALCNLVRSLPWVLFATSVFNFIVATIIRSNA